MIEINLLPGQKRKAPGAGFKLALPDFRGLLANIRNPWLIGAVVAGVVCLGGSAALFLRDTTRLASLESTLEEKRAEKRRYDVVIAQKRNAEKIRDSLSAEINVIRRIDTDRYIWPHVLDQITKALPPYTWLTDVSTTAPMMAPPTAPTPAPPAGQPAGVPPDSLGEPNVRVSITGRTVDIQAYTTFLRQLAASPWLTEVTPANSQTRIEADRPVTEFNVLVRYRLADSIYIRTVPLPQSVR